MTGFGRSDIDLGTGTRVRFFSLLIYSSIEKLHWPNRLMVA